MNGNWLLHYPVWELDTFGGGFLIAAIATFHVYIAHFAVGGGLFVVLTEMKARREKSAGVLAYAEMHARFFLLLSVVLGAVSGVAIWFVISVLNPAATSVLIHYFVFGWATEWVFFLVEIVALFVYYYTFHRMAPNLHLRVGWIYFGAAFLSLFVINGIVGFMLTPGEWIETKNFWDGFFNPTFWPALFFRSFIAFLFAGLFGLVTAAWLKDEETRRTMLRHCAGWLAIFLPLTLLAGWWYVMGLPDGQRAMVLFRSPETLPMIKAFLWLSPMIFFAGLAAVSRMPDAARKGIAVILVLLGFLYMGAFEWAREAGRRPYILYGYQYSNSLLKTDLETARKEGIAKTARFFRNREITDENRMAAGRELYGIACGPCHSVGGFLNDIKPLTAKYSHFGMAAMISGMGAHDPYMPPFPGNRKEADALAAYIVSGLNAGAVADAPAPADASAVSDSTAPEAIAVPPFDPEADEYLLLAWSGRGMYFRADADAWFSLAPPGGDLNALLIRRGELPEHVSDGVILSYALEGGSGDMAYDGGAMAYGAEGVPAVPFDGDGHFNPYPVVTVTARSADGGQVLAVTKTSMPVSSEMGCNHCHGGGWRRTGKSGGGAGVADVTAGDILGLHDRKNGTDLTGAARSGKPRRCQECHGAAGEGMPLNLSAAMHGFHAVYMTGMGAGACGACHPASPDTVTSGLRGIHLEIGLDCVNCHGPMADHALGLLKAEKAAGRAGAAGLMAHLKPERAEAMADVPPRKPWVQQPDCLHCHQDFQPPETDSVAMDQRTAGRKDLFRFRGDDAGIRCGACHGAPHAIYPAANRYGSDSLGPIQYQGNAYPIAANRNCEVCHTVQMEDGPHHPNSLTMFRNVMQ